MKEKIESQIEALNVLVEDLRTMEGLEPLGPNYDIYHKGMKRGIQAGLNALHYLLSEWGKQNASPCDGLETDAIREGVKDAMADFLSATRFAKSGIRPNDVIKDGIEKAFSAFLERHPMEIMDAIKGRERK